MTRTKRLGAWILGASVLILTCACDASTGHIGGPIGSDDGRAETSTSSNSALASGNGTGTGNDAGARDSSLVSINKAVLNTTCNPQPDASACTSCIQTTCCEQVKACVDYAARECVTLSGCTAPCADEACLKACTDQYQDAVAAYQDVMNCAITSCQGSCK
jgi:hypothetical protein